MNQILSCFYAILLLSSYIDAQQNYSSQSCGNGNSAAPPYSCNGQATSCRAFLIFKSKTPHDSVPSISNLTSANQEQLARINNVTSFSVFPTNTRVIVPINCSCVGQFFQANTTFVMAPHQTYYGVATEIFQGSATCAALKLVNGINEFDLRPGMELQVPLRCTCPTRNQAGNGVRYLLTYLVSKGEKISEIGEIFDVSEESILEANGFYEEIQILSPFSTILVPLRTEPSISPIISPSAPHPSEKKAQRILYVEIAKLVGFLLLVSAAIAFALFLLYKTRPKETSGTHNRVIKKWVPPADIRVEIANLKRVVKTYGFNEVTKATKRFSQKNRIKGSVYRGTFGKKMNLAVKRARGDATREINMLRKVYHFNLVKLEGVCENDGRFYLLFEYVENGSLREWLSRSSSRERWSWRKRIQLAVDIANGLHYLHSFTEPAYVHNNINSSNILLTSNLRAKISNFSLARTTDRAASDSVLTTDIVGTKGYLAPEYREVGLVTPKIDVYAFGVVVLELVSGKEAVFIQGGREVLLSAAMVSAMGENLQAWLTQFVDSNIIEDGKMEFALLMARLSVACLIQEPERRPSMGEVVTTLVKIQTHLQKPESSNGDSNNFVEGSDSEKDLEL